MRAGSRGGALGGRPMHSRMRCATAGSVIAATTRIEWPLVHRCVSCQTLKSNRIAGDDNEFVLMSIATRAIAMPPFPLEPLTRTPRPASHGYDEESS